MDDGHRLRIRETRRQVFRYHDDRKGQEEKEEGPQTTRQKNARWLQKEKDRKKKE